MKRIVSFILCLLILIVPAFADALVEPYPNDFYDENESECKYVNHSFWVNGKDGYITLWDSPNQENAIENIPNGESVYVSVRWNNWGCIWIEHDGEDMAAWLPMEFLEKRYGEREFNYEFEKKYYIDETMQSFFTDYEATGDIIAYWYPGSGYAVDAITRENAPKYSIYDFFTDSEGHVWGRILYKGWVYLDDPENAELPETLDRQPKLRPARAECENAPFIHYGSRHMTVYIASAAAGLAAVGAALIIYKKRRSRA